MNPELKKGKVLKIQNKTVFHISGISYHIQISKQAISSLDS